MCFNGEAFKEFLNITPRRPLEELKEVFSANVQNARVILGAHIDGAGGSIAGGGLKVGAGSVIEGNNYTIPPDNQLNAWRKEAEISRKTLRVHYTEDAHYQVEQFRYYLQEIWTKD